MTDIPAGGTADYYACPNPPFCSAHATHDYLPWLLAKSLGEKAKQQYYEVRPVLVEKP